jgi:hypothetical protein
MSWTKKITQPANAYTLASLLVILLILLVIAAAISIYALDITVKKQRLFMWLLREDGQVEQLTAILLGLAGLFALIAFFRVPETLRWARPFLVLFAAFSALMALEEISWGAACAQDRARRVLSGVQRPEGSQFSQRCAAISQTQRLCGDQDEKDSGNRSVGVWRRSSDPQSLCAA